MNNGFENRLDELLESFGLKKQADMTAVLAPNTNTAYNRRDSGPPGLAKHQPLSLGSTAKVPVQNLPNAKDGSALDGNGSAITQVGRFGGMEATAAYKAVRSLAKESSLKGLGFRKEADRLLAFGPSESINNERLIGFIWSAIKNKYASANAIVKEKFANDPLVKQFMKLSSGIHDQSSLVPAAALFGAGAVTPSAPVVGGSTLGAVGHMLRDISPYAFAAQQILLGPGLKSMDPTHSMSSQRLVPDLSNSLSGPNKL
jgi:hypothetical protein